MSALISNARLKSLPQIMFAGTCFTGAALLLILFFRNIPFEIGDATFGIDWQHIWLAIQNGHMHFDDWLRIVPWMAVAVLPLGFLSLRDSWSILTLLTLCILILSVPRMQRNKWWMWLGMLLLITSHPNLRELVDGNFEGLVVAGVVLFLYGYNRQDALIAAVGALIMVTKPQDTWLLCLAAGWLMWKNWPRRKLFIFGGIVLAIVIPSLLWFGPSWIAAISSLTSREGDGNVSLRSMINALGLSPAWLIIGWLTIFAISAIVIWRSKPALTREKAGFLMCASLMLTPYAEGNSFVTVLAIGIIPLFLVRTWRGAVLILVSDLPFIVSALFLKQYWVLYWLPLFLATWVILGWYVYQSDRNVTASPNVDPTRAELKLEPLQPDQNSRLTRGASGGGPIQ